MIGKMAWRNIWRNKLRSVIILMSVAIGLFAGLAVLALYEGMLKARVRTVIDAEVSHIQVHDTAFRKDMAPAGIIQDGEKIVKAIRLMPSVKSIAARTVTPAMLATTTGSAGIQVNGIIPEEEYTITQLKQKIIEGDGFRDTKRNQVMIGKKLADKMKLKPGSKLVITLTDTANEIVSGAFRVAAIYQSGNAPLDERNVYIRRESLNEMLGIGNNFHEIAILLNKDADLDLVKDQLRSAYPSYEVESWKDMSPETQLMVDTVDVYAYIIMVIIMFALSFGIVNTMLMAILERTREVGMMMALGMNRLKLFLLVLLETVFLTLTGTPVGLGVAWLVIGHYHRTGLDLSGMGEEMLRSFGYGSMIYPELPVEKLLVVMCIVVCTSLLSCLFPALKAIRLKPVNALRR